MVLPIQGFVPQMLGPIDDEGNIREFVVIDPGAFYDFGEEPEIIVNGTDS